MLQVQLLSMQLQWTWQAGEAQEATCEEREQAVGFVLLTAECSLFHFQHQRSMWAVLAPGLLSVDFYTFCKYSNKLIYF